MELAEDQGRGRNYKLRYSEIAKILIDYYINMKKQKDIAKELGIVQSTVSYYAIRYRKPMIRIIKKCRSEATNRISFFECVNEKLMNLIISRYGRRPKGRGRIRIEAKEEAIQ